MLRRAVLQLVSGVIVLDVVAMSAYYLAGIAHATSRVRTIFIVIWTVATAITVAVLLRRVRLARFAGRVR
ncbi:MAG: hypothetical protein JWL95_166 [Gemmatimonadetes bacterium]|nr:hypothetical protein [Gemmatimonadota bacterium]